MTTELKEDVTKISPERKEKERKETLKRTLRYQRDKDREKVKGIFRYFEVPGGCMSFVHKIYKEDKVERYDLMDGEVYTLPLGVAKHLNKNGWYPEYVHIAHEDGRPISGGINPGFGSTPAQTMRIGKKIRRFGFQSLEFVDVDEFSTGAQQIVTVEKVDHLGV
jgi:hypothetical protein